MKRRPGGRDVARTLLTLMLLGAGTSPALALTNFDVEDPAVVRALQPASDGSTVPAPSASGSGSPVATQDPGVIRDDSVISGPDLQLKLDRLNYWLLRLLNG